MLSLAISIVETILVKSAIFTVEKLAYGTYYAVGSMVNYYYPKHTELEILQSEVKQLQDTVRLLEQKELCDLEKKLLY